MSRRAWWLRVIWLVVAIALPVLGRRGGDAAIEAGLLFLIWTAPIGMLWAFYLHDPAIRFLPAGIIDYVDIPLIILLAYAFWFICVPWTFRAAKRWERPRPPRC